MTIDINKQKLKKKYPIKPEFRERIEKLLGDETEKFFEIAYTTTPHTIRCNTLKITSEELKQRLEKKGWHLIQPFISINHPEIMIIDRTKTKLLPGELGKTKEHLLGYYYVQELSSMLPILALEPKPNETLLDLCSSPGSKTGQAAALMNNQGLIIANELSLGRVRILASNLEKLGVMNTIISKKDGVQLCKKIKEKSNLRFDKIIVDAPCSGEGTLRKSPKTFLMWNKKTIENLSRLQKALASSALEILKIGGEMIYSTCTLSPEENEEVVDYLKQKHNITIEKIQLPIKLRQGICEWEGKQYNKELENACRLYPQDNDTDGFFLAKIKKLGEIE